jgi:hypothetical protein
MDPQPAKPRERSANVFINYRREDSAGHAGRLYDALSRHFPGRLFMDIDTLAPGVDFVEAIEQAVGSCEVLIVVIGRDWLSVKDKAGRRRLDDPGDFVRLEVESALARKIRVIPVLVQDTPMPGVEDLPPSLASLARRNAIELSDARWAYDVDRLVRTIREILKESPGSGPAPEPPEKATPPAATATADATTKTGLWVWLLSALVLVAAVALGAWGWIQWAHNSQDGPPQSPPANPAAGKVPTGGKPAEVPASGGLTATPPSAANGVNVLSGEPQKAQTVPKAEPSPPPSHLADKPSETEKRVPPVSIPLSKAKRNVTSSSHKPAVSSKEPDPRDSPAPARSLQQPVRVTILSPQNGETVGSDVLVRGVVSGLGEQQIFLCIRQSNGRIFPRGEVFPKAGGEWSIKLRSSKEKTFEILVASSGSKEANQILRDQQSRDDGLPALPAGASISSGIVAVKRQGKLSSIFNPKQSSE